MAGPHLTLSLARDFWREALRAALPFRVADGEVSLAAATRGALSQLQVTERVGLLLEDRRTPAPLVAAGNRAIEVWRQRREAVLTGLDRAIRVEGTWRVEIDDLGTELRYGPQKIGADAFVRGTLEGELHLLADGLVVPFRITQRVGASIALGRIRFNRSEDAVVGNVQDLALHLGDHAVAKLVARLAEQLLAQRVAAAATLPILRRAQVEGLVGGIGSAGNVALSVTDMHLHIDDEDLELQVHFGFARAPEDRQLTDRRAD